MVNLNSWSAALKGASDNQGVGFRDPVQKGDVPKGDLGGRQVALVPLDKAETRQNAEVREKLFQSLQQGVGQSKTEKEFLEKTRQDLGLDPAGKAKGDMPLKALTARDIVNVGRAQDKNATAMVGKALDAVIDRVPPKALRAIKSTILQQANHPDVVAFLDKYGSGGRDLKLLQRVCDLALRTADADRMTQAYLTGFRGNVRATADPVESLDEKNMRDRGDADLETQQKSDAKKTKSTEAPGGVSQSKTKTGTISRSQVLGLGADKQQPKSKTGPISRDKVLGGDSPKAPDAVDMKKLRERWNTIGGNYNATKASFEKTLASANNSDNQMKGVGGPFKFGKSGEFKLTLKNNSGAGNNCFFFSALCGMKKSGGKGGKDVSVTLQEAMQFRQQLNEHVEKRLSQLDKLKGVRYEMTSEDVSEDHLFVKIPQGEEKERSVQSSVRQHLTGEFLDTNTLNFKGADLSTAAFLADMIGRPVVVYAEAGGVQNVTTFDTNLETGEKIEGEPLRLYFNGSLNDGGHFQFVEKVEDTPPNERKQEVKIGYETVQALGLGGADPKIQQLAADKIKTLIEAHVKDAGGNADLVDALKQEIDKKFAAEHGAKFQETFKGVNDESTFKTLWDGVNQKNTEFMNAMDAVLGAMKNDPKYKALLA